MTHVRWWFLLPLGLGVVLPAAAQAHRDDADGRWAFHRDVRTAVRQDPPPVAHAPAWGGWADVPGAGWSASSEARVPASHDPSSSADRRRPDPNLRRVDVPGEATDWSAAGEPWQDPRGRHGWRGGWHGAAPGWGGVWGSGWGGDWPAYAVGWDHERPARGDGRWHGTFGIEYGWGAGHGPGGGFGHDDGRGVVALPAPRGD